VEIDVIQLYLLSVLSCCLTGFLLILVDTGKNISIENSLKISPGSGVFRLILGILTGVTGILKLLSPFEGIPILGDLVPALAGIGGGFTLLFGYYREHSSPTEIENEKEISRIGDTFLRNKKIAGFIMLAVAILHFLFPRALFL
jgi:hypothetical protein